jgi:hypothetical protein
VIEAATVRRSCPLCLGLVVFEEHEVGKSCRTVETVRCAAACGELAAHVVVHESRDRGPLGGRAARIAGTPDAKETDGRAWDEWTVFRAASAAQRKTQRDEWMLRRAERRREVAARFSGRLALAAKRRATAAARRSGSKPRTNAVSLAGSRPSRRADVWG